MDCFRVITAEGQLLTNDQSEDGARMTFRNWGRSNPGYDLRRLQIYRWVAGGLVPVPVEPFLPRA